jgi:DNA-binding transcriptional MerR regulator
MSEKLWLKIGEAAQLLGVSPKELRYWESVIPQIRPRRSKGNLRYYHREELPRLERIRDWLGEGLTVADCQQLLLTGQLKRSLGLELQSTAPAPAETTAAPRKQPAAPPAPQIKQVREALSALLDRLAAGPRPGPRKRRQAEPAVQPEPSPTPVAAPKPARSRKKPPAEPSDPNDFGPLFGMG